jgi:ornithine carbamoyltransferase
MKKDFLSILDISKDELGQILCEAEHLKSLKKEGKVHDVLRGKNLAMIFAILHGQLPGMSPA